MEKCEGSNINYIMIPTRFYTQTPGFKNNNHVKILFIDKNKEMLQKLWGHQTLCGV